LRVLDLATKVQNLIDNAKYFSALRVRLYPPPASHA